MAQQQFSHALMVAIFLVIVVGQINCDLFPGFERCDDTDAVVEEFRLSNCMSMWGTPISKCALFFGRPLRYKLRFTSPKDFDKVNMHYEFERQKINYEWDACSNRLQCPGKKGEMQTMETSFYVDEALRITKGGIKNDTLKFYLTDAKTNEVLVCIKFDFRKGEL